MEASSSLGAPSRIGAMLMKSTSAFQKPVWSDEHASVQFSTATANSDLNAVTSPADPAQEPSHEGARCDFFRFLSKVTSFAMANVLQLLPQ
jgi:hypothetical protein